MRKFQCVFICVKAIIYLLLYDLHDCTFNLKLTRRWGAATRVFIRMRHFLKTGVIKPGKLLSTFQKKQKNKFICVKLVIISIFCNEKVPFIDFLPKI